MNVVYTILILGFIALVSIGVIATNGPDILDMARVMLGSAPAHTRPTAAVNTQPTPPRDVSVNTDGVFTAPNNPQLHPTAAPAAQEAAPEIAPAPVGGLTEGMQQQIEQAANPGLTDRILNVVESWNEATPIPGEPPAAQEDGEKSFGRKAGGTSGGNDWGQP